MKRISDSDMEAQVIEFTKDYYRYDIKSDEGGGYYVLERYVDYREEFPESAISEILKSKNPQEKFWEVVDEWNMECDDWYYQEEFFNKLEEFCEENGFDIDEAREIVDEHFYWEYPDKFLNPTFRAVIMIDNGDANYEYTLHNILNYVADDDAELEPEAGLYWLAEQQGKLAELQEEIKRVQGGEKLDWKTAKGFVQTTIIELFSNPQCSPLTFLAEMKLEDAIALLTKQASSIELGQNATCGLYEVWEDGGSNFEIELEQPVVIPSDMIWRIKTDKNIEGVYGFTSKVWQDCVLSVK